MSSTWPEVALGEVATIVSGATPKTSNQSCWGGDTYWATPKDLSELDAKYISRTPRTLTDEGLRSCSARILPPGSLLLSSRAPIGLVAINTVPMATNQGFKSLIPDPSRLDVSYLYWWTATHRGLLESLGRGATFKEISKAITAGVEIPLPPIEEQRRIAAILDQADELRAKRRASLALLDSLTESIFLDMFGDPSTWAAFDTPLIELIDPARPISYGILMPGPDVAGGVPYVRVVDMKLGSIDSGSVRRTTPAISDQYRRSLLRAGDLLLSIRGHVGRLAEVPFDLDGANITQDSARLAIHSANPEFVLGYLRTARAQRWMARHVKGVAVRGINLGDVKRLPVPTFARADQDEFARRSRAAREGVDAHRQSLDRLDSLFASLRHRAFAGQL